jgi:hypothetical protein
MHFVEYSIHRSFAGNWCLHLIGRHSARARTHTTPSSLNTEAEYSSRNVSKYQPTWRHISTWRHIP